MNNKLKKIFLSSLILFFSTFSTLYAFDKPIVSDIKAEYSTGTKINIQWNLPKNLENPITKLLVYRDTKPIKNFSDINNATFLKQLSGDSFGYTDSVKDFRDYYYAVIAYTNEAYEFIMPSMNATVNGVRIPEKKTTTKKQKKQEEEKLYPSGTLRETPLPYLDLVEGFEKNENIISEKVSNSVKDLGVYSDRKIEILEPYYFEEDWISPESGDAYLLFQILKM